MVSRGGIAFPDEWLAELQPRRSGRRGRLYQVTDEDRAALAEARWGWSAEVAEVMSNPLSDQRLISLAGSGDSTVEAVAARLALDMQVVGGWRASNVVRADECVRLLGLPDAAAACVESSAARVVYGHKIDRDGRGRAFVPTASLPPDVMGESRWWIHLDLLDHLRRLLSVADESTWQATVDRLTPYRAGSWQQRVATSFLVPDRQDWVCEDIDELPTECPWWARGQLLIYCGFEPQQFRGVVARDLSAIVTVIDALGHEATPILLRSLDYYFADTEARTRLLGVITQIRSREAMDGLLACAERAEVPGAFVVAAAAEPELALELLLARRDELFVPALLAQHVTVHPTLPGAHAEGPDRPPDVSGELVPTILTAPPWTRTRPKPVTVQVPTLELQIRWLDDEREQWHWDRWPAFEDTHYDGSLATAPHSARFYLGGSEAAVRPRLATWEAEKSSFYLENPKLLVAKYELDAYPAVLRLARAKPVIGAELLLPYLSDEVTWLMAKWLASSRRFRPVAAQWFDRHEAAAVIPLLGAALGGRGPDARTANLALHRLDPQVVLDAGRELGAEDAVHALLATDPLDLVPAKVPKLPSWLNPDLLPPIRTRDRRHALGQPEVAALCRMVAMSQLDDPYAGLGVVSEAFDSASLAEFAWMLFSLWHIAGRPGKNSWAMDALGYFGDATTASRLAPLVRRWPSEGAAQRAKRGAELLGIMKSDTALRHLSSLARNAKSTPLRTHAAQVLDRVATERGLLPEQLDDLLAPDLGLDGNVIDYADDQYRPEIVGLDLVLRTTRGETTPTLPTPATDAQRAIAADWTKRRRRGRQDVADQARRLEEAMIVQRGWIHSEFAVAIAAHPLLGRLARRLIWSADHRLATVDALGDLVDLDGGLISEVDWVRLAHPATADLEPWRGRFHERGILQPFEQINRDVHDGDPSQYWHQTVTAASLYSLVRRGWHWGTTGPAATRATMLRPIGAAGSVLLELSPGLSAVHAPATQPDQRIEEISLHTSKHGELAVFADLPPVTRSELLRDLAALDKRPAD